MKITPTHGLKAFLKTASINISFKNKYIKNIWKEFQLRELIKMQI